MTFATPHLAAIASAASLVLLSACGGGGDNAGTQTGGSNLSGTVAVGAALAGASIQIKDANGTIREVTAECRHWEDGKFIETAPMSLHQPFTCPDGVGTYEIYRMYHEELESLAKHIPSLRRAQFWMSFSPNYLKHLEVLQNVGMTRIDPVIYQGVEIVPLQFLKAVLPNPGDLGVTTKGKTCIGNVITGLKDGKAKAIYIYNICDHEACFAEVGSQAISYTTGVPAMIGAKQMLAGDWKKPGVWNIEQHDPDAFMADLNVHGLPWQFIGLTPEQAAGFLVA
jgi:saccharopine dehydrogenase (NAD+, L-lysine-forming)